MSAETQPGPQLGTQKEFAALIGRSEAMVNKHKRAGRLVMVGRLVDFEASRARIRNAFGPQVDFEASRERMASACETPLVAMPGAPHPLRDALRDALCLQALLAAADGRSAGDSVEKLISECIVIASANLWQAAWVSPDRYFTADQMHWVGQIAALARARDRFLDDALNEPETDRLSFLLEQVGWLDSLAESPLRELVQSLQLAVDRAATGPL